MTDIIAASVLIGLSLIFWAGASFVRHQRRRTADQPYVPSTAGTSGTTPGPASPGSSTPATPDGLPRVQAILVGPKQSGKTMQLAAMHHQMSIGENGVRVKAADGRTSQALSATVLRIIHPDAPEPPPATDPANLDWWNFHIESRGLDGDLRPLFHLTYLDYAGEIGMRMFEAARSGAELPQLNTVKQQFQTAIENFDVVLGVLDGAKITDAMFSRPAPPGLEQDIWTTAELLSAGRQKVTHLVLTKWDEFYKRGVQLDQVVAYLSNHPAFRNLRSMGLQGKLRLIPVSALGLNPYLIPEVSDIPGGQARLVKSSGGLWDPFNAGLPLACGITDLVAADLQKVDVTGANLSSRTLRVPTSPVFVAILAGLGLLAAPHALPAMIAGRKVVGMTLEVPVGLVVQAFKRAFHQGPVRQELRAGELLTLPGRHDPARRAATANLLAYCVQRANDLEQMFPASTLR